MLLNHDILATVHVHIDTKTRSSDLTDEGLDKREI